MSTAMHGIPDRLVFEANGTVRKTGSTFRILREVEAMKFVQERTTLPIPAVLAVHIDEHDIDGNDESSWFTMVQLPGRQLGQAWPSMSIHAKEETIRQLKSYLEQLRCIQPTKSGFIGSCSMGPAYDHRLTNMTTSGPFASVQEFNDFLVAPVKKSPQPDWVAKYRCHLPDNALVHFAHADLSWENILVDNITGKVTGILDWEMSGFWPHWWEFRKALYGARGQPWWIDLLKQILEEYKDETLTDMDLEMY